MCQLSQLSSVNNVASCATCSRDFTIAERRLGLHRSVLNFVSGCFGSTMAV